jgi:hypothetical protein
MRFGEVIVEARNAIGSDSRHPIAVAVIAIRVVSMMGLALVALPNSHDPIHHQSPSPMAQVKSGGSRLGTSAMLPMFSTRPGMVKPTWAPA